MNIVCLTSNGYVNVVPLFARYFNQFGGEDQRVVVAGYDLEPNGLPDNFNWLSIGRQKDYSWSGGLLRYLEIAGTTDPHILLLLEDYFMTEPVDWDVIYEVYALMVYAPHILKWDLTDDRAKVAHVSLGPHYIASSWDSQFLASTQAAIWRVDFLKSLLRADESAWQFEKQGTRRAQTQRQAQGERGAILACKTPPMVYANAVGGEGNFPGQIHGKYMPTWMSEELRAEGHLHG